MDLGWVDGIEMVVEHRLIEAVERDAAADLCRIDIGCYVLEHVAVRDGLLPLRLADGEQVVISRRVLKAVERERRCHLGREGPAGVACRGVAFINKGILHQGDGGSVVVRMYLCIVSAIEGSGVGGIAARRPFETLGNRHVVSRDAERGKLRPHPGLYIYCKTECLNTPGLSETRSTVVWQLDL